MCPSRNNPDRNVQAGILSWGVGCNNETPGVYVNVPLFVKWIENQLQDDPINPSKKINRMPKIISKSIRKSCFVTERSKMKC